jgi:hypothetical protein
MIFGLSHIAVMQEVYFLVPKNLMPVTVAERSKACTIFARSEAGTITALSKNDHQVYIYIANV